MARMNLPGAAARARVRNLFLPPTFLVNKSGIHHIRNLDVTREARQYVQYRMLERQYRDVLEAPLEAAERRRGDRVWVCWLQGFDSAPDVVRACLHSLRQNLRDYEIVALDESNLHDYVQLPGYIEEKYRQGVISRAHYSDLIRLALLCEHGGLWIDATVLCTSAALMPVIQRAPLFVYKDYRISRRDAAPIIASNWFIGAETNHPILRLTQKLLYAYWERESKPVNYFLFHLFFAMAARRYPEEWERTPPYNNINPYTLQFEGRKPYTRERWEEIQGFSPFHKLSYHTNTTQDEASMYMRVIREYLPG